MHYFKTVQAGAQHQ